MNKIFIISTLFLVAILLGWVATVPGQADGQQSDQGDYTTADKSNWPAGVRPLTMDESGKLGVDNEGQLYWDGKKIKTEQSLSLTELQWAVALFGAGAAVLMAILDLLRFFGRKEWKGDRK